MYLFPNLDDKTRKLMRNELDIDVANDLFFYPKSLPQYRHDDYVRLMIDTMECGTAETLQFGLQSLLDMQSVVNGRKTPRNAPEMVAFSEWNRYYARALFVRAIEENKGLAVFRAKQVMHERNDSKYLLQHVYAGEELLKRMLFVLRDYRKVFAESNPIPFMRPNSGLSVRLV